MNECVSVCGLVVFEGDLGVMEEDIISGFVSFQSCTVTGVADLFTI